MSGWSGPTRVGQEGSAVPLDGPTLRAVRESMGVPLRRIARTAGMSHGHLSKVERGENGRPVTPAIMAAYERVTGVRLHEAAATLAEQDGDGGAERHRAWRSGLLTDMRRRAYNAAIGAICVGGHLGEPYTRLLDATGRPRVPAAPGTGDVEHVWQLGGVLTALDLRFGGALAYQASKSVLRWAVGMLDLPGMSEHAARGVHAAVGALAARTAWAALDTGAHEAVRSLFRLALHSAARADDVNLRAHVLADVAAQHNLVGYHEDALEIVRLGEGDERVAPVVRMALRAVKARTYAALGKIDDCRRHVDLAEQAAAAASPDAPGWLGRAYHRGHLWAGTGHALATLAGHTGDQDHAREATRRLAAAVDAYDPATHARARALCCVRLAGLHLAAGRPEPAAAVIHPALPIMDSIGSVRLGRELAAFRTALAAHPDGQALGDLAGEIGASPGAGDGHP